MHEKFYSSRVWRYYRKSNMIDGNSNATVERMNPGLHQDVEMQWKFHTTSLPCHKIRKCPTRPVKSRYWRKQIEIKSGKDRCESNWNTSS